MGIFHIRVRVGYRSLEAVGRVRVGATEGKDSDKQRRLAWEDAVTWVEVGSSW